jgi:hypothetical protein
VRSLPAIGGADPVAVVEAAFEAFARRDLPAMLSYCRPDIVLRTIATSQLSFRQAQGSVIGFGRADGRRGAEQVVASILWVVRVQEDQVASIEVFQAIDGGASLSPSQLERLTRPAPAAGAC